MLKKLIKALLPSAVIFTGIIALAPQILAADFADYDLKLEKQGEVFMTKMVLEKQEFNTVALKVEGKVQELSVDFGKGWEKVTLHDDYGLGMESLLFASPTDHMQFMAKGAEGNPVILKTTVFYYFGDGIGGPETDESTVVEQGYKIYSRAEWGADEKLGVSSNPKNPSSDEAGEEGSSSSACGDSDPRYTGEYTIVSTQKTNEYGQPLIWPIQKTSTIEKFAVHHSDSEVRDVTGDGVIDVSDYKAIVRAIYNYHTKTRGWGDIGYNYLIDPLGNIYEGRAGGDTAIGGHSLCFNAETLGIAIIGNYENQPISKPAFEALSQLIAQKSKEYNIDPLASSEYRGKYLDNIFGHRDVRPTACPGTMLYNQLDQIRENASRLMKNLPGSSISISKLDYNAELVGTVAPISLKPGESTSVTLSFKNTGEKTWDKTTWLHVAANDNIANGRIVSIVPGKNFVAANLKETSVAPGGVGSFIVKIEAGTRGGNVSFEVSPVINGKYKIMKAKTPISLTSTIPKLIAKTVKTQTVNKMLPGEKKYIEVEIQNLGDTTWTPENVKTTTLGRGIKTFQNFIPSKTVAPGEKTKIGFWIQAPPNQGYYSVYMRSRLLLGKNWVEIRGAVANFVIQVSDGNTSIGGNSMTMKPSLDVSDLPKLPNTSTAVDKPFRIRLSNEMNTALLTADTPFSVVNEKNEPLFDLPAGTKVEVTKLNSGFEIKNDSTIKKATIVRLVPKERSGVTEIVNFERRPTWNTALNDNRFRGVIEMRVIENKVAYINELPLEDYLRGLAEVSNDSPTEKQKVIAVLARTYARFYMQDTNRKFPGMPYDGSDDPNVFQRYLGYGVEIRSPNFTNAVASTENMVVKYNGKLVKTPYFNQSDGKTRSAQEVWGWTDTPYLKSVDDPWSKGLTLQGHGVGLSGLGATKQAEAGKKFEEIIKYYYTGVEVSKL